MPVLDLRFQFNFTQLQLNLPNRGKMWFYLDDSITVGEFEDQVKLEDPTIMELVLHTSKKDSTRKTKMSPSSVLLDYLKDCHSECYLNLNGVKAKFPTITHVCFNDITLEPEDKLSKINWFAEA